VDLVLDRHYLGEVISAHVALHANYLVQDLGSPPDIEKARGIAAQHPMDIRILGPGLDWVSDPAFPTLDVLQDNMEPGQPHMFFEQVEQAGPDAPVWMETLKNMYALSGALIHHDPEGGIPDRYRVAEDRPATADAGFDDTDHRPDFDPGFGRLFFHRFVADQANSVDQGRCAADRPG
jgi:hypothetical protein